MTYQEHRQEYLAFINSIESEATAQSYKNALAHYMKFHKISDTATLLKKDNRIIESDLIKYIVDMKQRIPPISYSLRYSRLAAIHHFYIMNDVVLNWKKISHYIGEKTRVVNDRAYTTEEIQQLLTKADERMRVVILLLASTGMRIGAIPKLKLRHLTKVDKIPLYQISVYENTSDEYYCFCSPECTLAIDSYLAYRERYYERLTPESPLIREQFDPDDSLSIRKPRHIAKNTLMTLLGVIILKAGIQTRKPNTEMIGRGRERKNVARAHGFRKFVTTNMIRAKVDPQAREMLLGHSIGLGNSYYRPQSDEILEEYLNAVDLLTIDDANRLKRKVKILTMQVDKITEMEEQINVLNKKLGLD